MQSLPLSTDAQGAVGTPISQPQSHEGFQSPAPDYANLFFDHLYSEYLTLRSKIKDPQLIDLLNSIHEKRIHSQLTWSDIYTFDLALIEERPLENLIRKAYDARAKYRSIAGQKEFDEYVASKPPDLTSILISPHPPESEADESNHSEPRDETPIELPPSSDIVQRVLRADIRYLLSKFYLYYAMLPMREKKREELTSRAVKMTKWILFLIVILILISFGGVVVLRATIWGDLTGAFGLTVGSVAFAGIVGGCVSMLQRIQSAPTEGDALFNLASLNNGWRGLSLSPLYGGIFASLLFVLFAAGVLEGSVFPKINTPGKIIAVTTVAEAETAQANEVAAVPASSSGESGSAQPAPNQAAISPTPTPTPLTETEKTGILQIKDFLKETGPTDGVSFALLIIWSFIAGFAERLVPDTLNRLVAKNEAIQGTK
jgi:hypothetical protein